MNKLVKRHCPTWRYLVEDLVVSGNPKFVIVHELVLSKLPELENPKERLVGLPLEAFEDVDEILEQRHFVLGDGFVHVEGGVILEAF